MGDDGNESLDGFAELLAEHARILGEKERLRASNQTPPTRLNYELTAIVREIAIKAKEHREAVGDRSAELRGFLKAEAEGGSLAAEDALDRLADLDTWWTSAE